MRRLMINVQRNQVDNISNTKIFMKTLSLYEKEDQCLISRISCEMEANIFYVKNIRHLMEYDDRFLLRRNSAKGKSCKTDK